MTDYLSLSYMVVLYLLCHPQAPSLVPTDLNSPGTSLCLITSPTILSLTDFIYKVETITPLS